MRGPDGGYFGFIHERTITKGRVRGLRISRSFIDFLIIRKDFDNDHLLLSSQESTKPELGLRFSY